MPKHCSLPSIYMVTISWLCLQQNIPHSPACKEEHDSELKLLRGTFWELPKPGDTGVWLAACGRTPRHTYPPGIAEMSLVLLSAVQQCRLFRAGKGQCVYKYQYPPAQVSLSFSCFKPATPRLRFPFSLLWQLCAAWVRPETQPKSCSCCISVGWGPVPADPLGSVCRREKVRSFGSAAADIPY